MARIWLCNSFPRPALWTTAGTLCEVENWLREDAGQVTISWGSYKVLDLCNNSESGAHVVSVQAPPMIAHDTITRR